MLDLACGTGEMLCTWARDHHLSGTGVDISTVFIAAAHARANELGVADPLPELIEHFGELGCDVVEMVLADQDSWDR